jgi:hypothetical protein
MNENVKRQPPALGDVTIKRLSDTEWALSRAGRRLASGLSFKQVLAIVRGVGVGFLDDLHAALRRGETAWNGGGGAVNHIAFYGGQTFPNVQTGRDVLDEMQNLQAGGAP